MQSVCPGRLPSLAVYRPCTRQALDSLRTNTPRLLPSACSARRASACSTLAAPIQLADACAWRNAEGHFMRCYAATLDGQCVGALQGQR
eukprot:gene19695-biopygen2519